MLSYSVFLPSYSVGEDCYQQIPYVTRKYGKTAVVIGGKTAMEKARQELDAAVQGSDVQILDYIWYGGDSNYENVEMLKADSRVQEADMLFGVGGGRACDTVKTLADMLDKPFFTFPTLASNCAACTAITVMYNPDGSFKEYYYMHAPSYHTFVNTKIMQIHRKSFYGLESAMLYPKSARFYLPAGINLFTIHRLWDSAFPRFVQHRLLSTVQRHWKRAEITSRILR